MKVYEELKEAFVGELSLEETQELAKFASQLMHSKRERDLVKVAGLLKSAADEIHDLDDFYITSNLMEFLEKEAADGGTPGWEKAVKIVGAAGLGLSAIAPLAQRAFSAYRDSAKRAKSLKEIEAERPELFSPTKREETLRNYKTIQDFAPHVSKNSLVSGNILHRMNRLGPAMMDINAVKELANTQKFVSDRMRVSGGNVLGDLGKGLSSASDVAKSLEGGKSQELEELRSVNTDQGEVIKTQQEALRQYMNLSGKN